MYYLAKLSWRPVLGVLAAVYLVLFAGFECYYFTEYAHDETLLAHFSYGLEDALELACEKGDIVYLDENEYYPKVLFLYKDPCHDIPRHGGISLLPRAVSPRAEL